MPSEELRVLHRFGTHHLGSSLAEGGVGIWGQAFLGLPSEWTNIQIYTYSHKYAWKDLYEYAIPLGCARQPLPKPPRSWRVLAFFLQPEEPVGMLLTIIGKIVFQDSVMRIAARQDRLKLLLVVLA